MLEPGQLVYPPDGDFAVGDRGVGLEFYSGIIPPTRVHWLLRHETLKVPVVMPDALSIPTPARDVLRC
jgi:hypothetical protein